MPTIWFVLLSWEGHAIFLPARDFITTFNKDFEDWFPRNFLSALCSTESNKYHLWWCKYVLYCWLLPATTFSIVFATLIKQGTFQTRVSTAFYLRKILIIPKWRWNIYFTSYIVKDNRLLQRVGIFRVQPGISEVLLVENTRELG